MLVELQRCFREDRVLYTQHARREMRGEPFGRILEQEVYEAISAGEIIEDYPDEHPIPVAWSLVTPGAVGQFTSSVLTCQKRIGPSSSPSTSPTRFVGLIFAGGLRYEMYHLPQH